MRALAISVLAHGILLAQGSLPAVDLHLAQPLSATLTALGLPAAAPQPTAAPGAARPQAPADVMARKTAAAPKPESPPAPRQESATAGAGTAPPATAKSAALAGAGAIDTRAGEPEAGGMEVADGMRAYRVALAGELRRFRRYPPRAVEAGISGTVELGMRVSAGGVAQSFQVKKSSGHRLLDEEALEMLRQAAPRTALPESLLGHAFSLSMPIEFDLKEE